MTTPTFAYNSNIIIEGNTFATAEDNFYDNLILLNLDPNGSFSAPPSIGPGYAVVRDNYLSGIASNGVDGYHIIVNYGSANITGNSFFGPGDVDSLVEVAAYINVVGSQMDHIITNNFFDSPTVDGIASGVNERLVIGPGAAGALTPNTLYSNNKNQTSYLPISKVPNLVDFTHFDNAVDYDASSDAVPGPLQNFYFFSSSPSFAGPRWFTSRYGSFTSPGNPVPTNNVPSYVYAEGTEIRWGTGTAVASRYTVTIDVDEYLPPNVQVLNFVIGLSAIADAAPNLQVLAGFTPSNYAMWANISVDKNPNIAYTAGNISAALANTVADVKNTIIGGGASGSFGILAGSGITNTGTSTVNGDVGTFPTTTETGFGTLTIIGTNHGGDTVTQAAKNALTIRYTAAAALTPTATIATDLNGQTLTPGVYNSLSGTFMNTGTVTLNGSGNYTFQMATTLVTASSSNVLLTGGAQAANITWQVGSSATLGTSSHLEGTILALTSITATTSATINGSLLAQNGAVTLDTNTVTASPVAPIANGSEVTTSLAVVSSAPALGQVTPGQLAAATQYLFLDVSSLPQFYTVMPDTRITVTYQALTQADTTHVAGITPIGFIDVFESPLIVKYRW
jgi:hypothetical protein